MENKRKLYINKILEYEGEYSFIRKLNGKGYDENHNIIYELKNGKGKVKEYNDNGKLNYEGEYLYGQENGIGKGYDYCGKLEYDGEYFNGKENGLGKKYDNEGNIIFEGEFLNGEKWNGKGYYKNHVIYELINGKGIVKEYNYFSGNLEFEGEYLNGKRNGKGKEYNYNGRMIFEGEYLNGKRHGKGKKYKDGTLVFEREYYHSEKK